MKLSTALLVGSLVANVAAAAWLFSTMAPTEQISEGDATSAAVARAKSGPSSVVSSADAASGNEVTWAELKAGDLAAMIARLRAAHYPDRLIRAIASERLRVEFADRRKALIGEAAPFAYWKPGGMFNGGYGGDPKLRAALRDLSREQTEALKAAMGPSPEEDDISATYRRWQFGNLPKEKSDQVSQIAQDYNDLSAQLREAANGLLLKEDRDKLAYLEEEKKKDLAAILTPEELADYQMRSSPTTSRLRFQLSALDLNETQFRAIYDVMQPFDEKYSTNGGGFLSPDLARERNDAQKQALANVKTALGEPLGTEYEHAMDFSYQSASRVVARLNLPSETVQQVVDVQKDIEQRSVALRTNRDLSPDQRATELAALNKEATDRLTKSLGEKGLSAYRDNGGYWLINLLPPATATKR